MLDRFLSAGGLTLLANGPLGLCVWYRPAARSGAFARLAAKISGLPISGFGQPPKHPPA